MNTPSIVWFRHDLRLTDNPALRRGPSLAALRQLVRDTSAVAVLWNRRYEPAAVARDTTIKKRRWVPELRRLPAEVIHQPWTAPPVMLRDANVQLGRDYPAPIVDHRVARQHALAALATIKRRPA